MPTTLPCCGARSSYQIPSGHHADAPVIRDGCRAGGRDLSPGGWRGRYRLVYTGPSTPYYRFVVRPDGYFDLFDPVTGARTSGPRVTPSARYRLTAIARTTSVYLYIDGLFVAQSTTEPGVTMTGRPGVFVVDGPHDPTDVNPAEFHGDSFF